MSKDIDFNKCDEVSKAEIQRLTDNNYLLRELLISIRGKKFVENYIDDKLNQPYKFVSAKAYKGSME